MNEWWQGVDPMQLLSGLPRSAVSNDDVNRDAENRFIQILDAVSRARHRQSPYFDTWDPDPSQEGVRSHAIKMAYAHAYGFGEVLNVPWQPLVHHMLRRRLVWNTTPRPKRGSHREDLALDEMRLALTENGYGRLRDRIVPYVSPQEGGQRHRAGVRDLYDAVTAIVPVLPYAPAQGDRSAADLVCELPERSPANAFFGPLQSRQLIDFQVECSTADTPRRRKANLRNSWRRGAYPIMVLPCEEVEPVEEARRLHRLLRNDFGLEGAARLAPEVMRAIRKWPFRPFSVWTLTKNDEHPCVQAYHPARDQLDGMLRRGCFGDEFPGGP